MTLARPSTSRHSAVRWCSSIALVLLAACSGEPSSPVGVPQMSLRLARPTSDVLVSSTAPDSAQQDTTLDVTINGSGFTSDMVATWALAGVADPAQVRTNSTRDVNAKTLVANITISAGAATGKWDVQIMSKSKGGIGTELFTIKLRGKPQPDPTSTFYLSNTATDFLRGDGLYVESSSSAQAGMSRYQEGECGVHSLIYAVTGGGDAIMGSDFTINRKCRDFPRGIRLTFARINTDGSTTSEGSESAGTFMNVLQLEQPAVGGLPQLFIAVGNTESRNFNFSDKNGKCSELKFRPVLQDGTVTGADQIRATRVSADTWLIQTQADETDPVTLQTIHHDKVWCRSNGGLYHMPMHFMIKSSTGLP